MYKMKNLLIIVIALFLFSCGKDQKSRIETSNTTTKSNSSESFDNEVKETMNNIFNSEIQMEVDESVFVIDNGTNRVTEDMSAGIMKMLSPQSYEVIKLQLENEPENQNGVTSLEIKEIDLGGKKVLVQKSMTVDEVGDTMIMMMHAIPVENKTMMISSFYPQIEESKYLPLIEKSVLSAKIE